MENIVGFWGDTEPKSWKATGFESRSGSSVFASRNGRIVEIIGDAFLVTFNSCLDAVECGINIQKMFAEYNSDTDDNSSIEIRMGIHIGDIIEYEGKIKGDAVNIAARIEEKSEAGSVTFSEDVNNLIRKKIGFNTRSLGAFKFKNIEQKVKLYKALINEQDI